MTDRHRPAGFAVHVRVEVSPQRAVDAGLVREAALAALEHQDAPANSGLSIVLSDDDRLRALNRQFAGVDSATDVLSFPNIDDLPAEPGEAAGPYLGDVVLSREQAAAQADAAGHDLATELRLLTVHGVLHLLGHDHAEPEAQARMWSAQTDILNGLAAGGSGRGAA